MLLSWWFYTHYASQNLGFILVTKHYARAILLYYVLIWYPCGTHRRYRIPHMQLCNPIIRCSIQWVAHEPTGRSRLAPPAACAFACACCARFERIRRLQAQHEAYHHPLHCTFAKAHSGRKHTVRKAAPFVPLKQFPHLQASCQRSLQCLSPDP